MFLVPVVFATNVSLPIATFWLAVVFASKAVKPTDILLPPVVFIIDA